MEGQTLTDYIAKFNLTVIKLSLMNFLIKLCDNMFRETFLKKNM